MSQNDNPGEIAEWKSEVRRLRAFWFGSRGFRPKLMRGCPILGWPESPKKSAARKSIRKSDKLASRY